MKNQFVYTRVEMKETTLENGEVVTEEIVLTDSFNVDCVIRAVMLQPDDVVVLLDDIHERTKEVPNINHKTNKVSGIKKVTEVFQSEIHLHGDDIQRFYNVTNIEND